MTFVELFQLLNQFKNGEVSAVGLLTKLSMTDTHRKILDQFSEVPEQVLESLHPQILDALLQGAGNATCSSGNGGKSARPKVGNSVRDSIFEQLSAGPLLRNDLIRLVGGRSVGPTLARLELAGVISCTRTAGGPLYALLEGAELPKRGRRAGGSKLVMSVLGSGDALTVSDIAAKAKIPHETCSKILNGLVLEGKIKTAGAVEGTVFSIVTKSNGDAQ